jgi:hypothetical protein
MPELYDGTPLRYKGFKTQVKVYLHMNKKLYTTNEECCLFICSLIQGNSWVQIYAKNFMESALKKDDFPTEKKLWEQLNSVFIDQNKQD